MLQKIWNTVLKPLLIAVFAQIDAADMINKVLIEKAGLELTNEQAEPDADAIRARMIELADDWINGSDEPDLQMVYGTVPDDSE